MTFAEHLRHLRLDSGRSLREFALQLGIDAAYLSRVEAGKVPPSDALISSATSLLGCDADELMLLAGRVPASWQAHIEQAPARALANLRTALVSCARETGPTYGTALLPAGESAIEDIAFPFEILSNIAEVESWRKELHRPIYHLHKWWAQRLGSVFRAILIGALSSKKEDVVDRFYRLNDFSGAVVFDPFMGSGTTIGEALKLGARAVGRDINPVAHFAVRTALRRHDRRRVLDTFDSLRSDVAERLLSFYRTKLPDGTMADVLYYFWVKVVSCPDCRAPVDLFSSYVFAQHAYVAKHPEAQALCPGCGAVNPVRYDARRAKCRACDEVFAPQDGPARGTKATCRGCDKAFPVIGAVRAGKHPPAHRLYAKLVLRSDGQKAYYATGSEDEALMERARSALAKRKHAYPVVKIEPGFNTNQVLNYQYTRWHEMFNERQLLCLSFLAERIGKIEDQEQRELFTCLFSGCLEFNNMFASYKGEGTGAVRHMFSHHILKPERTPIEANLWGTPKSSGAFSTLFENRLLRALDYQAEPTEIRVAPGPRGRLVGEKVHGISKPLDHEIATSLIEFTSGKSPVYLSCGDSARTDLTDGSVDVVVTDPPFFDNVHYSELADFFFVWQQHILGSRSETSTTRSASEVQQRDPDEFAAKLGGVWRECHRVLRRDGMLIFTYHHSRAEGWKSLLSAIVSAGFAVVQTHPIKAEMSVATPKQAAQEPIDLDIILVCRKRDTVAVEKRPLSELSARIEHEAARQITRLNGAARQLSRNDVRIVVMARLLLALSCHDPLAESLGFLRTLNGSIEDLIERLHGQQVSALAPATAPREQQQSLF